MKKTYIGRRFEDGCEVYVKTEDGKRYPLSLRTEIRNHSPTGFNWGYGGSGVSQLALAILADRYGPAAQPDRCPFCGSKLNDWKCEFEDCGYDGTREGDKWVNIHGRFVHYMDFKRDFLAGITSDRFEITSAQIDDWAATKKSERK